MNEEQWPAEAALDPSSVEPHPTRKVWSSAFQGGSPWAAPGRTEGRTWDSAITPEVRCPDVLAHADFLRSLELEKRRADRSNSPLSMVLFRSQLDDADGRSVHRLCTLMQGCTRETDKLGRLDSGDVAVVLPDTNAGGRQMFIDKILAEGFELNLSTASATYPDQLFASLAAGHVAVPTGSLMLDDVADAPHSYPLKRTLDVVGASVALVLLSPLMLAAAIAIVTTSPGPVIFRQKRLGKGGQPFVFYKFRSMTNGSDERIHQRYVTDLINGKIAPCDPLTADAAAIHGATNGSTNGAKSNGAPYKIHADPRITRVGRILRQWSIDEIPQFVNVLLGDMSLVGPRPPIPYEASNYKAWHLRRISQVRPGITGLWQVEGRSSVTFDEMVRMDLRYIQSCSLQVDVKILLKTVKVVLRCDGAR